MSIKVYYRTSDKGNIKDKVEWATREWCMIRNIKEFGIDNITVIADNCNQDTVLWVKELGLRCITTSLGNSKSFLYVVDLAIEENEDEDIVYLLEDDYIHREKSCLAIEEGLCFGDYVTLYDHPDYYIEAEPKGIKRKSTNALMHKYKLRSKIFCSNNFHWRTTYGTTMTFACRTKVLREDRYVYKKWTKKKIPQDFEMWLELTSDRIFNLFCVLLYRKRYAWRSFLRNPLKKKRILVTPMPSLSTHTEVAHLAYVVNWDEEKNKIY